MKNLNFVIVTPFRRFASLVAVPALAALVSACTASATIEPDNGGCSVDSSLACVSGTTGYSCDGSSQPEDTNQDLVCSTDQGTGTFCCSTSTCNYDSSVSCVGGAIGYSCATGAPAPDSSDSSLDCSVPQSSNNVDEYCCYTFSAPPSTSTCAPDNTVAGCTWNGAGSQAYGFACTGTESPEQDYSGIQCSTTSTPGTNASGQASNNWCCSYQ